MMEYRARRVPVHRGPAGWSAILPGQPPPVTLDADRTVDFAIVGGGFAGLSAAERLRQLNPGSRIAVLEAGRLAEGASGRNSGFMIDVSHDLASGDYGGTGGAERDRALLDRQRRLIAFNREAIAYARTVVERYRINPAYFRPEGKVNGAASSGGHALNQSYSRHLDRLGEPHETLDARAMQEMTGSRHYVSGLYTPGTVILQPAGYIRGFGEGLRSCLDVFENAPVLRFMRASGDWILETPSARITSGTIVLTNNGHLESFGIARNRLMHVFLFAMMTRDLDAESRRRLGGRDRWGITPSNPMGSSVRRISGDAGGHRILIRGCASYRPAMRSTARDLDRARRVMRSRFDQRFPQLAGMAMEHVWAGHLCLSRNGVTILRKLDNGLFAACCQNGLGTTRGTMTGIGVAELASDVSSPIASFFASEPEPARLPPPPVSTVAANAVLRWKEWRAGQE
ncbi:MAG: FAD-binding oxidoreductase [Paracoccaceae bacterium]|nr:FAD-binding oxidoreductase [Paracoccaceae bacterium]